MGIKDVLEENAVLIEERMIGYYGEEDFLRGGKKLRGNMILMIQRATEGDENKALDTACAVEYIQSGSLVHDDILDEHTERRGKPPIYIVEGVKKAVLHGDKMFAMAMKVAAIHGKDEAGAVADTMKTMIEGAMNEVSVEQFVQDVLTGRVESKFYHKIIDLKTASLFECAGKMAAMTYTLDTKAIDVWGKYGMYTGTAYQIADDVVDLCKLASGDLEVNMENVFGVLPALIHYNRDTVKKLPFMIAMGKAGLMEMLSIVTDSDIQPRMRADIDMYIEKARSCIPDIDVLSSEYGKMLAEYPDYCVSAILSEIEDDI